MNAEIINKLAAERRELAVKVREELHRIPEPSLAEFETTAYIKHFLDARGIEHETTTAGTGCVAVIGTGPDTVLLRADIDALPVEESTGAVCSSCNPGMMHACGHDVHAAVLLATADALASGELPFEGRVVLLFQPAEEGHGGGRILVEEGLLEKYKPRNALALHVWPCMESGSVGLSPGPVMAGMEYLRLTFLGRGGHGAHPQGCIDPIPMSAQFISTLPSVLDRKLNPHTRRVVTFGRVNGGTAANIIPDQVTVEGTIRWYEKEAGDQLRRIITDAAHATAAVHGGKCEVLFDNGYIPTVNDGEAVMALRPILEEVLGKSNVVESEPSMGSEDMSFILDRVPGCYLQLGAGADESAAHPLHSPKFYPSPDCLVTGIKTMLAATLAFGKTG